MKRVNDLTGYEVVDMDEELVKKIYEFYKPKFSYETFLLIYKVFDEVFGFSNTMYYLSCWVEFMNKSLVNFVNGIDEKSFKTFLDVLSKVRGDGNVV